MVSKCRGDELRSLIKNIRDGTYVKKFTNIQSVTGIKDTSAAAIIAEIWIEMS